VDSKAIRFQLTGAIYQCRPLLKIQRDGLQKRNLVPVAPALWGISIWFVVMEPAKT